jgi:hypothetical protein
VSKETLRQWMKADGLWLTRKQRIPQPHQPRFRRECFGELVQIDGCEHPWFESRGPSCSLLVYVDDATGKLMELRFVPSESTFDYFDATRSYLQRFGRPVAFYSDKHSIFRVAKAGTSGRTGGVTQFGRALQEFNIDIICANTPQAKGRVERMNRTLQDRLVKELRLRSIVGMDAANAFAPTFMADYNTRFARPPRNPHDAHRPLRDSDDLDRILTWQEDRRCSSELVVHHRRVTYLLVPGPETLETRGKYVCVHEKADGSVKITYEGRELPFRIFERQPLIDAGAIVENKRLGAALEVIQVSQEKRDHERLASKKLTLRQKERLREARTAARRPAQPLLSAGPTKRAPVVLSAKYGVRGSKTEGFYLHEEVVIDASPPRTKLRYVGRLAPEVATAWLKTRDSTKPPRLKDGTLPPPIDGRAATPPMGERLTAIVEFLEKEDADQKARRKVHNDVINQRKRELRLAERANAGR